MQIKQTPLSDLHTNEANPRIIKDGKLGKLVDSLLTFPKMLELRPIVTDREGVALGGNMRVRALQAIAEMDMDEITARCRKSSKWGRHDKKWQDTLLASWKSFLGAPSAPAVVADELSPDEYNEFVIKDNASFGEWDWDALSNEWDTAELNEWGLDVWQPTERPAEDYTAEDMEQKMREFREKLEAGEIREEDEEYQAFLEKFQAKKTTDDCFTPDVVYSAVAEWVAQKYGVKRKDMVRPFYPGGDYQKERYAKDAVVVDNPPFSILAQILNFYKENGIKFFLFAPTLTLFSSSSSSSSCALPCGVAITYENGASVNTSFLTNLEPASVRLRSEPSLYAAVKQANDENLRELHRELPKYSYDHHIITAPFVGALSRLGIEFSVPVAESESISQLDAQKECGKAIYGKGYIVSDRVFAEREKAEREKAERWTLSEKERAIVARLNRNIPHEGKPVENRN